MSTADRLSGRRAPLSHKSKYRGAEPGAPVTAGEIAVVDNQIFLFCISVAPLSTPFVTLRLPHTWRTLPVPSCRK